MKNKQNMTDKIFFFYYLDNKYIQEQFSKQSDTCETIGTGRNSFLFKSCTNFKLNSAYSAEG